MKRTKINNRQMLVSGAVAAGMLALAACGGSGGSSGGDGALKIGVVSPLSGVSEVYGQQWRKSIDICTAYANKSMGLESKIEVEYADGQGVPAASVTAMNKLANVEKVSAVLTGFSAVVKAVAPIANQNKIVTFNAAASSPDLAGLGDYMYNNIPLANQQVPVMVDYLVTEKKLPKWYLVKSNETLGESLQKAIDSALPKAGGELIGSSEVSVTQTDFGAQVAKIRAAKPDVIYLASSADVSVLIKQIRAAGIDSQIASYAGIDSPNVRKEKASEGSLYTTQSVDLDATDPLTTFYTTEYAKKYDGDQPDTLQSNFCGIVTTIAQAAKTLEGKGDTVDGENLRKVIQAQETFDVVGGKVTFADNGSTVDQPIDITQLQGGKSVVVSPAAK